MDKSRAGEFKGKVAFVTGGASGIGRAAALAFVGQGARVVVADHSEPGIRETVEPKKPAPTADYDEDEWNRIIDVDLRGVFLCMKYEIPLILKQGGGRLGTRRRGPGGMALRGGQRKPPRRQGGMGAPKRPAPDSPG